MSTDAELLTAELIDVSQRAQAERHGHFPPFAAPGEADVVGVTDSSSIPEQPRPLPVAVCVRLAGLQAATRASSDAAQAAMRVAEQARATLEGEMATALSTLGLDPEENWSVNFATGKVTRQPNPMQQLGLSPLPTPPQS